jgi:hypothetical protein
VVTGLTNSEVYSFTVVATNLNGSSIASDQSDPARPATIPTAPRSPLTAFGAGSVNVSWTEPVSDGGAAIIGYQVTGDVVGSTPTESSVTFSSTDLSVSGTGDDRHVRNWSRAGYVAYTFTVAAGTRRFNLSYANGAGFPRQAFRRQLFPRLAFHRHIIGFSLSSPFLFIA